MKKKILILYATYGSGHKSVAKYIENYFIEHNKDFEIKCVDILDYSSFLGNFTKILFDLQIKYRSKILFNLIYKFFDNKFSTLPYKEVVKLLFKKRIKNEILDFQPDLTISTHFFGSILAGLFNKQKITNSKIITVITDYSAHEVWLKNNEQENAYIVGNEIVKNEMVNKGIEEKKIKVFGIPVSDKFNDKEISKKDILKQYKLKENKKIFLFFAGSIVGSSVYFEYFKRLVKKRLDIQLIIIAGNNKKLKDKCETYIKKKKLKDVLILGYSNDIANLLSISDLVITKPGGITVTECLKMKKPMILVPGNGGPEPENRKFLIKKKFAYKVYSSIGLAKIIKHIVQKPYLLLRLKNNLEKTEDNKSIEKIYKLSIKMLKSKK